MSTSDVRLRNLIDAVAEGDKSALEKIYLQTNRQLYGAILRILRKRENAVPAMEEAYLRIWRLAANFDSKIHKPMNWLVTIARSVALEAARQSDDLRLGAYRAPMETDGEPEEAAATEMSAELKQLLQALGELSADLRKMMLLAYFDGWSRDALGLEFDAPPGTVRTWLLRSLEHVRQRAPA